MKNYKGIIVLIALLAIHNVSAVDMLLGAPVPTIQGTNYYQFSKQYRGYVIDQNNQVDINWVRGAVTALQQDGLYNSKTFLNVLWGDLQSLVDYYAQGNQSFKNATRQSLERAFNAVMSPTTQTQPMYQVPQPIMPSSPTSRQVIPQYSSSQNIYQQPAPASQPTMPWASRQVIPQYSPSQNITQQPATTSNILSLNSASERLEAIKNGALGQNYADKVRAICSADYTVAKKLGLFDLCDRLQRTLVAPQYRWDPKKGPAPDLAPTIDELKNEIDRLSRTLESYRAKGNAS